MEPWIETSLGDQFWYTKDDTNGIELEDIAGSLSKICRFTGHCKFFYSVAEHSVNVALLLPKQKRLWGLLHDASEAYLADIASPVKQLLPDYRKLEKQIMTRIAKKFDLPELFWEDPCLKRADWSQLKSEAEFLLPSKGKNWLFPPELETGFVPVGYSPENAKAQFMEAYKLFK